MITLSKTIVVLRHLHRLAKVDLPPFVDDFHLETYFVLDIKEFIFALTYSPHLSIVVLQVWCMNFCKIVLSMMIMLMTLIFFCDM